MQRFVVRWNALLCKESPEHWKVENEWHKKKKEKEEEEDATEPSGCHSKPSESGLHKAKFASQHC